MMRVKKILFSIIYTCNRTLPNDSLFDIILKRSATMRRIDNSKKTLKSIICGFIIH